MIKNNTTILIDFSEVSKYFVTHLTKISTYSLKISYFMLEFFHNDNMPQ